MQPSQADKGTPEGEESFMNVGPPLVADAQPAELMQPSQGSLNHPTIDPEAAAVLGEALGQDRLDSQRAQCFSVRFRMISSVSLNLVRSPARPPSPALELVEWPPPRAATGSRHDD